MMFCNNASCDTEKMAENCYKAFNGKGGKDKGQMPTYYQEIQTQQSQRNPSSYQHTNTYPTYRQDHIKTHPLPQPAINQVSSLQVIPQNTKHQHQHQKASTRNMKIASILSTLIAFSQRIQTLKQKLAGYPGQCFSPVEFFNVLDLTQKGFVDVYDIKRFVNNQRISEKDILALFKRVNGDHVKDNNKLSYFGYLNLIKPYFNQPLARDLLLRDAGNGKRNKKNIVDGLLVIQPTQQSVLLLFQQLILLQCICTSQHQQSKQSLMSSYMLNVVQLKHLIGLHQPSHLTHNHTHKTPLKIIFQFIENNSQYQLDFAQMKYLLAYLNAHEFSLTNEKCLSQLFIPMNIKAELVRHLQEGNIYGYNNDGKGMMNYMKTYLTKQNLINKGNIMPIKEYLQTGLYIHQQQQSSPYNLTQNHMAYATTSNNNSKANFLQFVHPKSLQRITSENNNNHVPQFVVGNRQQQQQLLEQQYYENEHPQMQMINPSNKYLSKNQSRVQMMVANNNPSYRQYSNPSSIPQQNIKIHPPRQPSYHTKQPHYQQINTSSSVSHTPFLQRFMKQNPTLPTATKNNYPQTNNRMMYENDFVKQKENESKLSDNSAFEVVDYGYEANKKIQKRDTSNDDRKLRQKLKYADDSQQFRKQSLDSRYNLVVSQYRNNQQQPTKKQTNLKPSQLYNQQSSSQYKNYGPKFQRSVKINNVSPIREQYSKGNYIDSVGLSQSNMVEESQFINRFYEKGGNILNEFLKKA